MEEPLISIIIPTYNRKKLIGETLNSILAQSYKNWECIIVDDESTDESSALIKSYVSKDSRFQYHAKPSGKAKGGNACRNYGFKLSKGEYVNWFDDDDVMLEDFLKSKLEAFTNDINFVIGSHYTVDENLNNQTVVILKEESYLLKDYLLWRLKLITNSVLFRKSFLLNKKLFDEKIIRGQETELFSRLFFEIPFKSYKILNIPLFLYREHNNRKSGENLKYIKSHKKSESYIAIEVLKKIVKLKDTEFAKKYYDYLINSFFRSIENNHIINAKFILKHLVAILKFKNVSLSIELIILGNFFLIISRGVYKIEKRWKLKEIKI